MENQLLIAALRAQLIVLSIEQEVKYGYACNEKMQFEAQVLHRVIAKLIHKIEELEKQS